jgi:hypothetical protein
MTPLQILKKADKIFEDRERWFKGAYKANKGKKHCYCAVGVLRAASKDGEWYGSENHDAYKETLELLSGSLPKQWRVGDCENDIIEWNDAKTTRWAGVRAAFARAIKKAERT